MSIRAIQSSVHSPISAATCSGELPSSCRMKSSSLSFSSRHSSFTASVSRVRIHQQNPDSKSTALQKKSHAPVRVSATAMPADGARPYAWAAKGSTADEYPYGRLVAGVAAVYGADMATAAALKAAGSTLPSPVVLLMALGAFMALGGRTAAEAYDWMLPAISFFDQWMPLFFVPSISAIALAPLPKGLDLAKSIALLGLSYLFTLWATAGVATYVRGLLQSLGLAKPGGSSTSQLSDSERLARIADAAKVLTKKAAQTGAKVLASTALSSTDSDTRRLAAKGAAALGKLAESVPAPKAQTGPSIPGYSLPLHYALSVALLVPAVASIQVGQVAASQHLHVALAPGLLLLSTALFNSAKKLPASIRTWLGPTLAGGIAMTAIMAAFGLYTGTTWQAGIGLYKQGGGALLASLINPAVAALGFKVYSQRALLQQHANDLVLTCLIMAPVQFAATALLGRALGAPPLVVHSLLPAHTTLGMALPMGALLHASRGLIVAGVTIAGTTGISTARTLLDSWRIRDPTIRGLAVGVASHSLGTSALVAEEPRSAAVSGLTFALKGAISVVLVSLPAFRQALLLASG